MINYDNLSYCKVGSAIAIYKAIEKSPIELLQENFAFWVHQYHFCSLYNMNYIKVI